MMPFPHTVGTHTEGSPVQMKPGSNAHVSELSMDLMRYSPAAPSGVMDYLFVHVFEWGKAQGYQWFNLGMAPLATVGEARRARPTERLAHLVFQHGEHWYNFRGLRQYKDKFRPRWTPRYLAYPTVWEWPRVIAHVSALIAGGWRAILVPRED
jgi:phosphatidylglycerol lysyltransferase